MATRFSPGVLPNAGPRFDPDTLARAIEGFQREQEYAADRKEAATDRTRRREIEDRETEAFEEDRDYTTKQRARGAAREDVADIESGIETRDQFSERLTPYTREISRLRQSMENPAEAAIPTRLGGRPPGALDARRQSFREEIGRTVQDIEGARPISGGRMYLPSQTPQARATAEAQQYSEEVGQVAQELGADPAIQRLVRLDPDALGDYIEHNYGLDRDSARDAASLARIHAQQAGATERTRITQAGITERDREGGGASGLTRNQALTQARQLVFGYDAGGRRSYAGMEGLVQEVADAMMNDEDVDQVIEGWNARNVPPGEEGIPTTSEGSGTGLGERLKRAISTGFMGAAGFRRAQPDEVASDSGPAGTGETSFLDQAWNEAYQYLSPEEVEDAMVEDGYLPEEIEYMLSIQ